MPSLYDDNNDDNCAPPTWNPPSAPQLPKWVHATQDVGCALAGDPVDRHCACSQFDRAFYLFAQASDNYDRNTFVETLGYLNRDVATNGSYRSLLANDICNLIPLPNGQKPFI